MSLNGVGIKGLYTPTLHLTTFKGGGIVIRQRYRRGYPQKPTRIRKSLKCVSDVNWDAFGHPPLNPGRSVRPIVRQYDFVVVGSGVAGLSYALKVAEYGNVAIVTKQKASDGCTKHAQGGVCAVLDASDSIEDHIRDTLVAGVYLNDRQ